MQDPRLDPTGYFASEKRIDILKETVERLSDAGERERLRSIAFKNVKRWAENSDKEVVKKKFFFSKGKGKPTMEIRVCQDDWGVAAQRVTKEFGKVFAVLNMANSRVAGGGYLTGMVAQEENMFRRTDCHFSVMKENKVNEQIPFDDLPVIWYTEDKTDLLTGKNGRVYLDVNEARICVRGREDLSKESFGYDWFQEDDIFPFYELRAAALDLRGGDRYTDEETMKRIKAQLDTLKAKKVRHVVLSAFGCGAFMNPAEKVAACYKKVLKQYEKHFDVVCFAIFHAGYGYNNYIPFRKTFFPDENENV